VLVIHHAKTRPRKRMLKNQQKEEKALKEAKVPRL
jgi:hypothetical protein